MNASVEVSPGIEGIKTEETEENESGDILIRVPSLTESALCRECGNPALRFYGHGRETYLRHLPVFGHRSFMIIRPKRYQCTHCEGKPAVTQTLPWYSQNSPNTLLYENHILFSLVSGTASEVMGRLRFSTANKALSVGSTCDGCTTVRDSFLSWVNAQRNSIVAHIYEST